MALTDKLTAIADAIRAKTGGTDLLSLDGMASAVNGMVLGDGAEVQAMLDGLIDGNGTEVTTNATKIRNYAFYNHGTTTNINMPNVTSIGNGAFNGCTKLALTSLPEGVTSIGNSAFQKCSELALTSLPEGVTNIEGNTFSGCTKLALTSLPEGVTSIGAYAFCYCLGLTNITFKGKPSTINSNVFQSCSNLLTINVPWAEGEVVGAGAPWGAPNATINYNYTGA